jgi:hypothetical protein
MQDVAFWYEYRRRADILLWLAFLNPVQILAYALVFDTGRGVFEFCLLGLGVNFVLCLAAALGVYVATHVSIRRSVAMVRREKTYLDIIRRGPFMRVVAPRSKAG